MYVNVRKVFICHQNCSIAVVGDGDKLSIYDDDDVSPYLEGLDQEERRGGTGAARDAPAPAADEGSSSTPAPPPAAGDQVSGLSNNMIC